MLDKLVGVILGATARLCRPVGSPFAHSSGPPSGGKLTCAAYGWRSYRGANCLCSPFSCHALVGETEAALKLRPHSVALGRAREGGVGNLSSEIREHTGYISWRAKEISSNELISIAMS